MNAGLLIIILLLGLALLGFPIYIALGIGALAALDLADLPLIVLPQRMFAGMNGSALLADSQQAWLSPSSFWRAISCPAVLQEN